MFVSSKLFLAAAAVGFGVASVDAATIADVKLASATSGNSSTIDSAVVTQIIPYASGSTPTAFLAQDATGAIEIYVGATNSTGYTPAVGDTITATGNSYSFHGLYELESYTAGGVTLSITKTGTSATPTPNVFTTATISNSVTAAPLQSELGTLSSVTFVSPSGNFASAGTYTVTDGTTTATVFVPANNPLIGTAVPTGAVDISGYLGWYTTPELVPLSIAPAAATPEPASLAVLSLAGLATLRRRRA